MSEPREVVELQERIASLEERLASMDERLGAERGLFGKLEQMMPGDAAQHLRAARREQLLAVRSLIDAWIARVEREPGEPRRRREEITID